MSPRTGKLAKCRNVPTVAHGITFHSRAEANRYCELRLLERPGEITDLSLQPVYPLIVEGVNCGKYIGDFQYVSRATNSKRSEHICEDVKGFKTPLYRLKKKLVAALYKVQIVEIA